MVKSLPGQGMRKDPFLNGNNCRLALPASELKTAVIYGVVTELSP